jgi:hypothetical protein
MLSSASAAKYPLSYSATSSESLAIVPGNDTITSSCLAYPCASMEARSKNEVEISLTLFRAQIETPQPQTFYTNLAQIVNNGNTSQNIDSIFVRVTSGAMALGALTVFYCSLPSKDPYAESKCAMFTMNSTVNSGFLIGGNMFPVNLTAKGGVGYIGAAGFANISAKISDQISFQIIVNTGETS